MQSINSIRPVTLNSSRFSGHQRKHTSLKRKSNRSIRYLRSAFIPACSTPRRFLRRHGEGVADAEDRERISRTDRPRSVHPFQEVQITSRRTLFMQSSYYVHLVTICVSTRMAIRGCHTCRTRQPGDSNCLRPYVIGNFVAPVKLNGGRNETRNV